VAAERDSRKLARGFTLIELLVVMAIMSLVIGSATFSFSLFSRHWERRSDGFEREVGQLQRIELVSEAVEDALPWVVKDSAGSAGFYFLGRDEGLTLVSGSPVFEAGRPAVVRLFRESDGVGRWRLVYEEAPLAGVALRNADQVLPFRHRLVVASGITELKFRYFGWSNVGEKIEAAEGLSNAVADWWDEYDGIERGMHPDRIGLTLGGDETVFDVPQRADIAISRLVDDV
jgi:prepilin-type N-terminal cleavage/methylation domain-containing protein